jgi:hypothetical protein
MLIRNLDKHKGQKTLILGFAEVNNALHPPRIWAETSEFWQNSEVWDAEGIAV